MEGRECTFILFQAHARGYLMRKEINCARSEFEDIVRDIDGEVNHLEWKGHIIAIPHFKDFGQVASSGKSLGGSKLLPFKNDGGHYVLSQVVETSQG